MAMQLAICRQKRPELMPNWATIHLVAELDTIAPKRCIAQVARISVAQCGTAPGFRFAYPGYESP